MRVPKESRSQDPLKAATITTLERVIDLEIERGHFAAGLDTPTLAYAILRISESFLYSDVIADRTPDIDRATTVIEGLLTGLDRRSAPV